MQLARSHHAFELDLDGVDALLDHAPVELDLRLAGTAEEAASAALALEMGPGADEASLLIAEMRKLDLEAPFARSRAASEDLEDEARAVEHLGVPGALEIALLDRRHGMIDDDELGARLLDQRLDLLDLAGAEQRRRPRRRNRNEKRFLDVEIDGLRQTLGLGEAVLRRVRRNAGVWFAPLSPLACFAGSRSRASEHRDEHERGRTHLLARMRALCGTLGA